MLKALVLGMECHNIYSLKFMHVGVTQKRIIIAVVWAINIKWIPEWGGLTTGGHDSSFDCWNWFTIFPSNEFVVVTLQILFLALLVPPWGEIFFVLPLVVYNLDSVYVVYPAPPPLKFAFVDLLCKWLWMPIMFTSCCFPKGTQPQQ